VEGTSPLIRGARDRPDNDFNYRQRKRHDDRPRLTCKTASGTAINMVWSSTAGVQRLYFSLHLFFFVEAPQMHPCASNEPLSSNELLPDLPFTFQYYIFILCCLEEGGGEE